jgi:thioredoxin 2
MTDPVHVVCPHCDAVNRAPRERLRPGVRGKCGRCGRPLFEGHPIALTAAPFGAHAERGDLPLLVDFWAPWCGPCRAMAPMFERAAARLEPRLRLAKVNTDEEPALAERFQIRSIPTLILLRGGREVARQAGAMDAAAIERWVGQHA